jgi:DNA-binding MarR family transcriptional regulator
MSDPIAALQEQMIALIRAFGLHQGDRTPCGKPVSVAEAHALLELSRHAPLAQRDLAAWLRLEKSTVSRLVAQLVAQSWVQREPSAVDGRVLLLSLTAEGQRIAGELSAARRALFAGVLQAIPPERRDEIAGALGLLVEAINASRQDER